MAHGNLRAVSAAALLLALGACGGRALIEDGAAAGGQSGTLGTGGHSAAGGDVTTTPQGGGSVTASGGSSSTMPACKELCESILCIGGNVMTPPGQCCPVCVQSTTPASDAGPPLTDAGPAQPPLECPGLTANPPPSCPLTRADVACSSDSDCATKMAPACDGCLGQLYGVNRTSTAMCGPTACPPPGSTCAGFDFQTQDCRVTPKGQVVIGAQCVAGQCFSFAGDPL
jgi:hypothetical protein